MLIEKFFWQDEEELSDEQSGSFWTPERKLLLGVLRRAVLDYVSVHDKQVSAAEDWIFAEPDPATGEFFSFGWVCDQLSVDPKRAMEAIRRMPKQHKLILNPHLAAE